MKMNLSQKLPTVRYNFKHLSSGKILLVEKSDNRVLYHVTPNLVTPAAWYGLVCKAKGRSRTIVFLFVGGRKKSHVVLQCMYL